MDLQFEEKQTNCLRKLDTLNKCEEQTQDIRLGENLPDVGRILGSWGQVLLRGKEWRGSTVTVKGGIMAWVLYEPEGGGTPCKVESWIPFQMKWDQPEPEGDGVIQCCATLKSVDARIPSARKIMVRANVCVSVDVMERCRFTVFTPGELPETVQLLRKTYPVSLSREAGEKTFELDEFLEMPDSCEPADRIVYYRLEPEILEHKVMSDKIVFRGLSHIHVFYCTQDGHLSCWDEDIPFSQYGELEQEYESDAEAELQVCVTGLELELEEDGQFHLKAALVGQYCIYNRENISIVEDAYSCKQKLQYKMEKVDIPAALDTREETLPLRLNPEIQGSRLADIAFYPEQPSVYEDADGAVVEAGGWFQILYWDSEGNIQCSNQYWNDTLKLPAADNCRIDAYAYPAGKPQGELSGSAASLEAELRLRVITCAGEGIPMISGMSLGDAAEADPDRPSLIIRKSAPGGLWELAKSTHSTVDAIKALNHLEGEPEEDRFLLIPVS